MEHSHVRPQSIAGSLIIEILRDFQCGKSEKISRGLVSRSFPPLAFSLVDGLRNRIFLPDWTLDKLFTLSAIGSLAGVGVYRTPMIICCHGFFQALLNLLFVFIKCLITLCGRPAAGLLLGVTEWGPCPQMLTKWKAIARQLLRHYIDTAHVFFLTTPTTSFLPPPIFLLSESSY